CDMMSLAAFDAKIFEWVLWNFSVMSLCRKYIYDFFCHFVYQPVFLVNSSRPKPRKIMFQRLRFSCAEKRMFLQLFQEDKQLIENNFVARLFVCFNIIFGFVGKL